MFDLDKVCREAQERINAGIEQHVKQQKHEVFVGFYPKIRNQIPLIEVQSRITLEIHNEEQFYRCVKWCNNRIGTGRQFWTVRGKVLKYVATWKKDYDPPAIKEWVCFVPGVHLEDLLIFTK